MAAQMTSGLEPNKQAEVASAQRAAERDGDYHSTKPFHTRWGAEYWVKWATISHVLSAMQLPRGAKVLDIGVGIGWTTLFLAESGYQATGIDIAPANVELGRRRAERWAVDARFEVADMDSFDVGSGFDAALVFDALHHTARRRVAVENIARHLRPGGWVLFGEPSWLHSISPGARRTHKETGWLEKGIAVRGLKADCRAAGLDEFERFFEGTRPYQDRGRSFAWQLVRLAAANVAVAPQSSVWLLARKSG
jgi:2-polyprenyl-3-methyl-5-hydroxy-6-metoxy-1,4-benzoquinol methylase